MNAGGDEEAVKVGATEGAGSGFDAGEIDLAELFACVRIETDDAAAVAEGYPKVAVGVDRHAVGGAFVAVGCGIDGDARVADGTTGIVEIVGADLFGRGVDVIHLGGVRIPADTIGVGDFIDFEV